MAIGREGGPPRRPRGGGAVVERSALRAVLPNRRDSAAEQTLADQAVRCVVERLADRSCCSPEDRPKAPERSRAALYHMLSHLGVSPAPVKGGATLSRANSRQRNTVQPRGIDALVASKALNRSVRRTNGTPATRPERRPAGERGRIGGPVSGAARPALLFWVLRCRQCCDVTLPC